MIANVVPIDWIICTHKQISQMPEGPEVRRIAESINQLSGKHLLYLEYTYKSRLSKSKSPNIPIGSVLKRVYSIGKLIVFHFIVTEYNTNWYNTNWYITSFLAISGNWRFRPGDHSYFQIGLGHISNHINIIDQIIYYDDPLQWGRIEFHSDDSIDNRLSRIGPDLLSCSLGETTITLDQWKRTIYKTRNRSKNKQICTFLMEQQHFSGIGNYLKAEILYRSGVRPDRVLTDLNDAELEYIFNVALITIKEAYYSNGFTLRSYQDPNGNTGKFQPEVYGQHNDPYGNPVVKSTFQDKRTTHWVPAVQI